MTQQTPFTETSMAIEEVIAKAEFAKADLLTKTAGMVDSNGNAIPAAIEKIFSRGFSGSEPLESSIRAAVGVYKMAQTIPANQGK